MLALVVDVETTGLDRESCNIIEIAIKRFGDKRPTWTTLVRPNVPIEPDAYEAHGIAWSDVEAERPWLEVSRTAYPLLASAEVIIGYNVSFDLDVINAEQLRADLPVIDLRRKIVIDAMHLWRTFEPRTLIDAHRRFAGYELDGAHSAAYDVEGTERSLAGMLRAFGLEGAGWPTIAGAGDPDPGRRSWCGPSRHLRWSSDGAFSFAIIGFGKHDGIEILKLATEQARYCGWLQRGDFPSHVKRIVEAARRVVKKSTPPHEFYAWLLKEYPNEQI